MFPRCFGVFFFIFTAICSSASTQQSYVNGDAVMCGWCCCFLDLRRARSHFPSILHINQRQTCGTRSPQHLSQSFIVSQITLNIHNPWWTLFRFPLLSNFSATSLSCGKPRFLHSNQVSWNCTSLCTFVYVYPLLFYLYSFYLQSKKYGIKN